MGHVMDYETFLSYIYTPLKSIELLSDTIYYKYNEEWDFIENEESRKHVQELLSLNFSIKQVVKYLLNLRKNSVESLKVNSD